MTDVAMENQTVDKKPNKFAMLISCLLAFPLAAVLLVHPAAMLDDNGHYSHGVGFVPRHWIWKWLFSPFLSWPLMIWGYYTWFFS